MSTSSTNSKGGKDMISAYRTGPIAGNAFFQQWSSLDEQTQQKAASAELTKRRRQGIAHYEPEQEFVQGFLDG